MTEAWLASTLALCLACASSDNPEPTAAPPPSPGANASQAQAESAQAQPAQATPTRTEGSDAPEPPDPPDPSDAKERPVTPHKSGKDFAAEVEFLYRLAACEFESPPDLVRARFYRENCAALARAVALYRTRWLDVASLELARLVPDGIPDVVVYPFGGGDLLSALATFSRAREITTISLELAGDVSAPMRIGRARLEELLTRTRKLARFLFLSAHSRTSSMGEVMRADLPAQIILGLIAMAVNGYEPVSLRYVRLNDDGSLAYYEAAEMAAATAAGKSDKARGQVFANVEIEFREKADKNAPTRIWRHFSANLSDRHLGANHPLLAHLRAKGGVTAMTKAASYLLWFEDFSTIRQYLLDNAVWMISDSTGIMPEVAAAAGFEQITYGSFEKTILSPGRAGTRQFRKLWKSQPSRPLAFRYGYPDGSDEKHAHLVITRKRD